MRIIYQDGATIQSQLDPLIVSVGVQCHVGSERTENQDRVTRARTPFGDLFVVADGIGGYRGGSEAAQATVDGFATFLKAHGERPLPDALQQALQSICEDLQDRASADPLMTGMGSTVALCVVKGDLVTYAHVGDSRLYLLRDGQLRKLTSDHSMVERLVAEGVLSPEQARQHPDAGVLTRAIGSTADATLDIDELRIQPDDALLLCSDGLWAYAPHGEMEIIAATQGLSTQAVADALLSLALEGGGGDNIGIQFLRFKAGTTPTVFLSKTGPRPKVVLAICLAILMTVGVVGLALWNRWHPLSTLVDEISAPVSTAVEKGKLSTVNQPVTKPMRKTLQQGAKDAETLEDKLSDEVKKGPE